MRGARNWDEPRVRERRSEALDRDTAESLKLARLGRMIAFRENGNSYYVVNTLLNRMSNETMLAIAKGLKPLSGN